MYGILQYASRFVNKYMPDVLVLSLYMPLICDTCCFVRSCGLEILEDVPDVDVIVVCCGGGGLLSGIAAAVKLSGKTKCQVIGVEPEAGVQLT